MQYLFNDTIFVYGSQQICVATCTSAGPEARACLVPKDSGVQLSRGESSRKRGVQAAGVAGSPPLGPNWLPCQGCGRHRRCGSRTCQGRTDDHL